MVKQAYGNNHTVNECIFYFDTSGRGKPNVTLDFPRILPEKWTMMKEGTYQQVMCTLLPLTISQMNITGGAFFLFFLS